MGASLDRAIKDKHAKITEQGKQEKIEYIAIGHSERYSDPEEWVRAEYWAELIYTYGYAPERIGVEITVPDRVPGDRADLIVFEDDERTKPFIVIECKKDGISDAEFDQAIEQAWGNGNWAKFQAKYIGVVAGNTRIFFQTEGYGVLERDKNIIADIPPQYGKPPEFKYHKGGKLDIQSVKKEDLIAAIKKSHDTLWGGGRFSPPQAFGELTKVMFVKIEDEKAPRKKGEPYQFQNRTNESAEQLGSRIRALYDKAQAKDPNIFTRTIEIDDAILRTLVSHLEGLNLSATDLDTKGVAFEQFMDGFFKGDFGQYFTPREVIEFMVQMTQPKHDDLVLDPACGSGGFLLYAMDHIRKQADEYYDKEKEPVEHKEYWHRFAQHNLFGIEINDEIGRVAKMNMILHDDGHSNILGKDALIGIDALHEINRGVERERFDLILTNPPFGAIIRKTEHAYLENYELGKRNAKVRNSQKSEILFLERCIDFLKEKEGSFGIIIPDSITINTTLQYVRDYLLERVQMLAIISLPDFAFSHFGANVKSSILFMRKLGDKEKLKNYPIFMASAKNIGYTSTGKKDVKNDLPIISKYYHDFLINGDNTKIDSAYEYQIDIVNYLEIAGNRFDVKGYSKKFKELKSIIQENPLPKIKLQDCLSKTISGNWGLDLNSEVKEEDVDYTECYVLRNTNFDNDFNLDLSDIAIRLINTKKIENLRIQEGDILIEKSGGSPIQPVGRVALIREFPKDKPVVFSNFLLKVSVNEKTIDPLYVYTYLRSLYKMGYMEFIQNQTTGIKNLLMDEFLSIPILKINRGEQSTISSNYLGELLIVKSQIDNSLSQLEDSRIKTINQIFS